MDSLCNEGGLCISCDAHEVGEAIGRIDNNVGSPQSFDGYASPMETESKIIRDVLSRDDAWFRTGDLIGLLFR